LAARKKLERDFANALRVSRSFREVPHARARPTKATEWRLSLNNGSEAIQFGLGNFLQIDAPSRTGGHGDTLDDGTIDEAFSQEDDTVEGAMRPAMATRKNAQLWVISTAGDARSRYLWRKVLAGRAATDAGEHGRVCYIEFSAPDDADPGSPATWWGCMPALGITVTEQFIQGEWDRAQRKGAEGIATFRRAYLNQWPEVPNLGDEGADRDVQAWLELADPLVERGKPVFGVDVDTARQVWIGAAWRRADGLVQVELIPSEDVTPLTLEDRVARLREKFSAPVGCGGTTGDLAGGTIVKTSEFAAACGTFTDLLSARQIRHGNHPPLNLAVAAKKVINYGTAGAKQWQLRDVEGIGPLAAVTRALAVLASVPPSVYETRGALVI
jgi:hypothetical protein